MKKGRGHQEYICECSTIGRY